LLAAGTDMKYGARHLKRAIERLLVQPLSNLIATGQVEGGDLIRVDCDGGADGLTFFKEVQGLEFQRLAELAESSSVPCIKAAAAARGRSKPAPTAKSTRRG